MAAPAKLPCNLSPALRRTPATGCTSCTSRGCCTAVGACSLVPRCGLSVPGLLTSGWVMRRSTAAVPHDGSVRAASDKPDACCVSSPCRMPSVSAVAHQSQARFAGDGTCRGKRCRSRSQAKSAHLLHVLNDMMEEVEREAATAEMRVRRQHAVR